MDEKLLDLLSFAAKSLSVPETGSAESADKAPESVRCEILESLRPFLGPERRALLDRVIGLVRILELAQKPAGGVRQCF